MQTTFERELDMKKSRSKKDFNFILTVSNLVLKKKNLFKFLGNFGDFFSTEHHVSLFPKYNFIKFR